MIRKIHFIGVGGSGISGVARLAQDMGYQVSGCDNNDESAYIKDFLIGHNPSHLAEADLVVTSPALFFESKNDEIEKAKSESKLITWQNFVGSYLQKSKKVICVCGTHGKSTTSAMVGKMLSDNGFDPTVVMGASYEEWKANYRFGKGDIFVIEADEFNNNFLNYSPEIIIVNNIEFDHPDFFKDKEEIFESFLNFFKRSVGEKIIIANIDDPGVVRVISLLDDSFNIHKFSKQDGLKINLSLSGNHNLQNAFGVYELGKVLEISEDKIKKSLENFKGVGRRMELLSGNSRVKVYDDYAHHPTAIKATLEAIRQENPCSKIWVIDEPHGYARTRSLLSDYKGIFDQVDKVLIGPIYKARDIVDATLTPQVVASGTNHKDANGFNDFSDIKQIVQKNIEIIDVVVVMGAGNSYRWGREILKIAK